MFVLDQCSSTPAPPAPCMKYLSLFHPIGDPEIPTFFRENLRKFITFRFFYPFLADSLERLKLIEKSKHLSSLVSIRLRLATALPGKSFFLFCPENSYPEYILYLLFWVRLDICLACVKYACLRVVGTVLIDTRDGVASNKTEPIRETSIDRQHTAGIKTHKQTTGNPFGHII